jgi:2-iminobutanoate/2-iminopropanoate deaminase
LKKVMLLIVAVLWAHPAAAEPLPLSPAGVKTLAPNGAIRPTGTWSLGTRAGDFVFIAGMRDAVRLVVYVTDMYRFRPFVNKVQEELWGAGPYPPRTIIEVQRLNGDDICEVEGTFYAPRSK